MTVVGHTTSAINYRPRKGDTDVDFTGTTLMPLALGKAKVQGKKGVIDVEAKFDKLQSPTQFGPEYLTYVLWAITPEGRATNLGEIQVVNGDEAKGTPDLIQFSIRGTFQMALGSIVEHLHPLWGKGEDDEERTLHYFTSVAAFSARSTRDVT